MQKPKIQTFITMITKQILHIPHGHLFTSRLRNTAIKKDAFFLFFLFSSSQRLSANVTCSCTLSNMKPAPTYVTALSFLPAE